MGRSIGVLATGHLWAGIVDGAKLEDVRIAVTDTARHFIMWDDPNWMFAQMDRFLEPAKTISAR